MPATIAELPPAIKSNLPTNAQKIWLAAYNSALKQYNNDKSRAARVAWAAVKLKYKKANGDWVLRAGGSSSDGFVDVAIEECYAIDFADKENTRVTADGYLIASPRISRTGIQVYRGYEVGRDDMQAVRVYRPPDQVFDKPAMGSLAYKPITLEHPREMVNSANWKQHAVGQVSGEIARDGEFIRVPLVVMDQAAIDAVRAGKAQLSVGYGAKLVWEPGQTETGEAYDAVQTEIRANHVAIVDMARGGHRLRIGDAHDQGSPMPPIANRTDLELVIANIEQFEDPEDVKEYAIERASELDLEELIPADWKSADDDEEDEMDSGDSDYDDGAYFDREFSTEQRQKMASKGQAMSHGGFPIASRQDLLNAIKAIGRAKNRAATIAHIKKRARALGLTSLLPEKWGDSDDHKHRRSKMTERKIDGVVIELDDRDNQILERHLASLDKQVSDSTAALTAANSRLTELQKAIDTKDGEIAALKKQLGDAAMTPQKLDQYVRDRLEVVERARMVLGDKANTDGKTDVQIRRETVAALMGDQAAKDMSDDAITGAFFALTKPATSSDGVRRLAGSFGGPVHSAMDAASTAWDKRNKQLSESWRRPSKSA